MNSFFIGLNKLIRAENKQEVQEKEKQSYFIWCCKVQLKQSNIPVYLIDQVCVIMQDWMYKV